MHWIATTEKDSTNNKLEKRLWDTADQFRANSAVVNLKQTAKNVAELLEA